MTADAAVDRAIEGGPREDLASSDHADSDLYEGSEDEAESQQTEDKERGRSPLEERSPQWKVRDEQESMELENHTEQDPDRVEISDQTQKQSPLDVGSIKFLQDIATNLVKKQDWSRLAQSESAREAVRSMLAGVLEECALSAPSSTKIPDLMESASALLQAVINSSGSVPQSTEVHALVHKDSARRRTTLPAHHFTIIDRGDSAAERGKEQTLTHLLM